jgi:hypothetical protein
MPRKRRKWNNAKCLNAQLKPQKAEKSEDKKKVK